MPLNYTLTTNFHSINLPLILCGPIIRIVDSLSVSVWCAVSRPCKVTMVLWNGYQNSGAGNPLFTTEKQDSYPVGERLHISVSTARHTELKPLPLSPGTVISYDLVFEFSDGKTENLKSLNLLQAPALLGFAGDQLPSFLMAPLKTEELRVAHGSCRKPHGRGNDGLVSLARVIEDDFVKKEKKLRPHAFFHTGDQIYADDVATCLLPYITEMGNYLLGVTEKAPFPKKPETLPRPPVVQLKNPAPAAENLTPDFYWFWIKTSYLPPARRKINLFSGFSGDQGSHLISLAEFCTAYIFQWCDEIWPDSFFTPDELDDLQKGKSFTNDYLYAPWSAGENEDEKKERYRRFTEVEQVQVKKFRDGLPFARRVLANVPNLMMCDDHDVTDDWNLNGEWVKDVYATMLGRTIVRNGMLAFSLFQAWGNMPEKYAEKTGPYAKLHEALKKYVKEMDPQVSIDDEDPPGTGNDLYTSAGFLKTSAEIDSLLSFDKYGESALKWHFSFNLGTARVMVLDTRTRRDFSLGATMPPNLLGKKALEEQVPVQNLPMDTELYIIVSPVPVLGLAGIEELGQPVGARIAAVTKITHLRDVEKPSGSKSLDVEHWPLHHTGFEQFLNRCFPLKKVIFLSGDVHYGISTATDYWKKGDPQPTRFIQLISSSLQNEKPEGTLAGLLPASLTQVILAEGLNGNMSKRELFGWNKKAGIKLRRRVNENVFVDARSADYPLRFTYALNKEPVLLTLRNWPLSVFNSEETPGKIIKKVLPRIVVSKSSPVPDWHWRLSLVHDTRSDTERFATVKETEFRGLSTDLTPVPKEPELKDLFERSTFITRSSLNRRINWFSHTAILHFQKSADKLEVIHSFYCTPFIQDAGPGNFDFPFMRHRIPLEADINTIEPEIPREP